MAWRKLSTGGGWCWRCCGAARDRFCSRSSHETMNRLMPRGVLRLFGLALSQARIARSCWRTSTAGNASRHSETSLSRTSYSSPETIGNRHATGADFSGSGLTEALASVLLMASGFWIALRLHCVCNAVASVRPLFFLYFLPQRAFAFCDPTCDFSARKLISFSTRSFHNSPSSRTIFPSDISVSRALENAAFDAPQRRARRFRSSGTGSPRSYMVAMSVI